MKELAEVNVLVTGGAGFIGSEVVRQLCEIGASITVLDNFASGKIEFLEGLNTKIIRGSVCDKKVVSEALKDQEILIHLAALPFIPDCYTHPKEFFKVNTMGTLNVTWEAIQSESAERMVYVSSSEVYGSARYVPMDENHPTLPHSTYAVSKLSADRSVFTFHKEHNFSAVIVRPFNSFGPNITQPYIIPEIISQLFNGDHVRLGNIDSSRDFTFVSDTARGIILACVKKEAVGETINLGSGRDIKIKDLVYLIAGLLGKKGQVKIEYDESRFRSLDVNRLICDYSKAEKILGWKPTISWDEGLVETINWMKNHTVDFKEPFRGWSRALIRQNLVS